ncbi:MAG: hypothetical protein Q8909_18590, partial [Bacteroidota bacterium]|nr:hypothetical protein [Bacteroidota bacterium]
MNPIQYNRKTVVGTAQTIVSQDALVRAPTIISDEKKKAYDASPMQDMVRVWEVQRTGTVNISTNCQLLQCDNSYLGDGVTVSIQYNDSVIWKKYISSDSVNKVYNDLITYNVEEGQRIYFRLQSVSNPSQPDSIRRYSNGFGDLISWSPKITYSGGNQTAYDYAGLPSYTYKPSDAYFISSNGCLTIDSGQPIRLTGTLSLPKSRHGSISQYSGNYINGDTLKLRIYLATDSLLSKDSLVNITEYDSVSNSQVTKQLVYKIRYNNPNYYPKKRIFEYRLLQSRYANSKVYALTENNTSDTYPTAQLTTSNPIDITCSDLPWLPGPNHYWFEIGSNLDEYWDSITWKPQLHLTTRQGTDSTMCTGVKYNLFTKKLQVGDNIYFRDIYPLRTYNEELPFGYSIYITNPKEKNIKYTFLLLDQNGNIYSTVGKGTTKGHITGSFSIEPWYCFDVNNGYFKPVLLIDDTVSECFTEYFFYNAACDDGHTEGEYLSLNISCLPSEQDLSMGSKYRGWGQFEYNASGDRWKYPIKEEDLTAQIDTTSSANDPYKLAKTTLFKLEPEVKAFSYWQGLDEHLYFDKDRISTGRLNIVAVSSMSSESSTGTSKVSAFDGSSGIDTTFHFSSLILKPATYNSGNIDDFSFDPYFQQNSQVQAANKIGAFREKSSSIDTDPDADSYRVNNAPVISSKFSNTTTYGGASATIGKLGAGVSASKSSGSGYTTSNFVDLNGDGYPDRITETEMEFSNARGGRDNEKCSINENDWERSNSSAWSVGFSGGYSQTYSNTEQSNSSATTNSTTQQSTTTANHLSEQSDFSVNVSVAAQHNADETTFAYIDLNGDGLPDKLQKDGSVIKVCFNKGYSFSNPIPWCFADIHKGKSEGISGSASVNFPIEDIKQSLNNASQVTSKLKFGLNMGYSTNTAVSTSYTLYSLSDVNGDGLVDQLYVDDQNNICVSLNMGNSFASP